MPSKLDLSTTMEKIIHSETNNTVDKKRKKSHVLNKLQIENKREQSRLNYIQGSSVNNYLKVALLQNKDGINPEADINTSNVGLSRDLGLVNYYPVSDLYRDFITQLDITYCNKEVKFEDVIKMDLNNKFVNSNFKKDLFQSQIAREMLPITQEGYMEYYKYNHKPIESNNLHCGSLEIYQEILATEPVEINLGILDDMVYTTTNSINLSFIDGLHASSKIEVPCTGILFDIISDILTVEPVGYDMYGNLLSNINAFLYNSNAVEKALDTKPLLIEDKPVSYLRHKGEYYKAKRYVYNMPVTLFPIINLLHSNSKGIADIRVNITCMSKLTDEEDIELLSETISLSEFKDTLPLGNIQPIMKLFLKDNRYYAYPLTFTKNYLYTLNFNSEEDEFCSNSLLSIVVDTFKPEIAMVDHIETKDKPTLYTEIYYKLISQLRLFMGNTPINDNDLIYSEINNFNSKNNNITQNATGEINLYEENYNEVKYHSTKYKCPKYLVTDKPFEI